MSTTQSTPRKPRALPPLMTLTDAAADRLRALYGKGEQGKLLRIGVKTKGCSGLSYDMTWTDEPAPGDEVVNDKGLDRAGGPQGQPVPHRHRDGLRGEGPVTGFTFTNPNEKGRCGCGESFHV